MNIFLIDINPTNCAKWSCDQHVVKILTEAVEIYCSALYKKCPLKYLTIPKELRYKPIDGKLIDWATNTCARIWLTYYIFALNKEYEYRFGKKHKAYKIFKYVSKTFNEFPFKKRICYPKFEQIVLQEFKGRNSIIAYRKYYKYKYETGFKIPMRWTKRRKPKFLGDEMYGSSNKQDKCI